MPYLESIPRRWVCPLHRQDVVKTLVLVRWLVSEVNGEVEVQDESIHRVKAIEFSVHCILVQSLHSVFVSRRVNGISCDNWIAILVINHVLGGCVAINVNFLVHLLRWVSICVVVRCGCRA